MKLLCLTNSSQKGNNLSLFDSNSRQTIKVSMQVAESTMFSLRHQRLRTPPRNNRLHSWYYLNVAGDSVINSIHFTDDERVSPNFVITLEIEVQGLDVFELRMGLNPLIS